MKTAAMPALPVQWTDVEICRHLDDLRHKTANDLGLPVDQVLVYTNRDPDTNGLTPVVVIREPHPD